MTPDPSCPVCHGTGWQPSAGVVGAALVNGREGWHLPCSTCSAATDPAPAPDRMREELERALRALVAALPRCDRCGRGENVASVVIVSDEEWSLSCEEHAARELDAGGPLGRRSLSVRAEWSDALRDALLALEGR